MADNYIVIFHSYIGWWENVEMFFQTENEARSFALKAKNRPDVKEHFEKITIEQYIGSLYEVINF